MNAKIRIENVVKIYGRTPRQQPLKLLKEGMGKDEIFQKTKHVVGVNDVTFNVGEGEIFVVMGLSGSGKSSLAFDTIYAEGQRRYVESLSASFAA